MRSMQHELQVLHAPRGRREAAVVAFHLDYDRQSDLDDSVGYWYVQPTGARVPRLLLMRHCCAAGCPPRVHAARQDRSSRRPRGSTRRSGVGGSSRKRGAGRLLAGLRGLGDSLGRPFRHAAQAAPPPLPKLPPLPHPAGRTPPATWPRALRAGPARLAAAPRHRPDKSERTWMAPPRAVDATPAHRHQSGDKLTYS